MQLIAHENIAAVEESARLLKTMGAVARKLLVECLEHQQVCKKKRSAAVDKLESAGFLFVREEWLISDKTYVLIPALLGEEALEYLEENTPSL